MAEVVEQSSEIDSVFGPVVHVRAALPKQIAERLREIIVRGQLKPGDRLPGERELAERLNVSHTSLREAVRLLEAVGLLVVRRGRGVYVKETDVANRLHEAIGESDGPSVDPREIRDLYRVRRVLEVEASGWAARHIRKEQLLALERVCAEAGTILSLQPRDFERLQELDGAFHGIIFASSGNSVLVRIMESLFDLLMESRRYSIRRPGRADRTWKEHRRITDALSKGDAGAARASALKHIIAVERSCFARNEGM